MVKNVQHVLDDEATDQCASTSEKKPKLKVCSEPGKLLHFTFVKDISYGKYFVLIGSVYSGTTPKMYVTSLHMYLCTKFSIN